MYHTGPGVKKSGPKGPHKVKGEVRDVLVEELHKDPSAPSHVVSQRVAGRTGVVVSPRSVRRVRQERGKSESSMPSGRGARPPRSQPMSSYRS